MKHKLLLSSLIVLVSMSILATPLFAEEASSSQTIKKAPTEKIEKKPLQFLWRKESASKKLAERFARHEERANKLIERAEKQLAKAKEKGKDTRTLEAGITAAKASLANAKTLAQTAIAQVESASTLSDKTQKKEALKTAQETAKKADIAFAQVMKDLQKAAQEIKATERTSRKDAQKNSN